MPTRPTNELKPWSDDIALKGPSAPKNTGMVEHLIEYLLTVHKRFGNTATTCDLQWGSAALWKRSEQAERIAALEAELRDAKDQIGGAYIALAAIQSQANTDLPRAVSDLVARAEKAERERDEWEKICTDLRDAVRAAAGEIG